jgi:hypothetical protein
VVNLLLKLFQGTFFEDKRIFLYLTEKMLDNYSQDHFESNEKLMQFKMSRSKANKVFLRIAYSNQADFLKSREVS